MWARRAFAAAGPGAAATATAGARARAARAARATTPASTARGLALVRPRDARLAAAPSLLGGRAAELGPRPTWATLARPFSAAAGTTTPAPGSPGAAAQPPPPDATTASAAAPAPAPAPGSPGAGADQGAGAEPKEKFSLDRRVWPIAASSLLAGTAVGVVFPIMPQMVKNLGLTPSEFGMIVSVIGVTRLAFNVPAAWAADKYGRRSMLVGGPLLGSLGMATMSVASSFYEMLGSRFLTGAGGSMQMTGAQMYLSDISSPRTRARTMAPIGIAFGLGATIGPAIGGVFSDAHGLRAPLVFVSAATAFVSLLNWFLVPETKKPAPPTPQDGAEASPPSIAREFAATIGQWRPLMRDPNMRSVMLMHLTYWCVQSGCVWTLLPLIATDKFQLSTSSLGGLFALMSVVGIVGMGPAAWLSDTWGRKKAVVPAVTVICAALSLMPFAQSHEQMLGLIVLSSMGSTFFNATPSAFVADVSTEQNRGQALALLRSAGDAGLMLGATTLGTLAHFAGQPVAFGTAAVALGIASANFVVTATEPRVLTQTKRGGAEPSGAEGKAESQSQPPPK